MPDDGLRCLQDASLEGEEESFEQEVDGCWPNSGLERFSVDEHFAHPALRPEQQHPPSGHR